VFPAEECITARSGIKASKVALNSLNCLPVKNLKYEEKSRAHPSEHRSGGLSVI
jgi:hypothetical protein